MLPASDSFGNATTPPGVPVVPPPVDGGPAENRRWWDSLTTRHQQAMITMEPIAVGGLDGVPASARDRANRTALSLEHARLTREIDELQQASPSSGGHLEADGSVTRARNPGDALEDRRQRLADLDAIDSAIAPRRNGASRVLMALDVESGRHVRVVAAVGDPDTAAHVSVTTPGLNTTVRDSLGGMLDEADALKTEAEARLIDAGRREEAVATIAWIGYDPPQNLVHAAFQVRAQEAASALASFFEGLDVASVRNDPHITALGHSYGSLVTSLALQERGRAVDDVVFYGSPGLGRELLFGEVVDSAADLEVDAGRVYQMTAPGDRLAELDGFGDNPNEMDWIIPLSTEAITVLDGTTYTSASGHSEYARIDRDTGRLHRSGYNLAAIVAGLPELAIDPQTQ
ncbi:alpha/beta hydrolase [Nocardia sp. CNY236]|uniref:alpha/beta hydrolase n=1 Tax=Nocardia sp. CNY236 TaxID=1169152 RepID=UPI0004043B6E|nr:alpha/beta hydrolase [Nocardia sp. CNY236]